MENVMTLNQFTDKMFSIMETALYNYEINTLVEAADDPEAAEANKESKWSKAMAVVKAAMAKVWNAIRVAYRWVIDKLNAIKHGPITLDKDIEIYKGALSPNTTLGMYAKELLNGRIDCVLNGSLDKEIDAALKEKETKKAGETINSKDVLASAKKYEAMAVQLTNIGFKGSKEDMNTATDACKKVASVFNKFASDCRALAVKIVDIQESKVSGVTKEQVADLNKKMNESADTITLAAQLLIEAANLLNEDAEDYVDGIEGGEGTQKDIDDIPEERPAIDDEYPADAVTGGVGEKIDQEEIKDLVDGDKEAIDILNDDEGSKAITESVIIHF